MKFFLDTANIAEIEEAASWGVLSGVTTNPTIFAAAFQDLSQYGDELAALKAQGASVEDAIAALMSRDVADACDVFADVYASSKGYDGRVSIEVAPTLAMESEATCISSTT